MNAIEQAALVAHWEKRVMEAEARLAGLVARANMTEAEAEALLTARGKAEGSIHAARAWLTRARNGDDGKGAGGKATQTKADKRREAFARELAALNAAEAERVAREAEAAKAAKKAAKK